MAKKGIRLTLINCMTQEVTSTVADSLGRFYFFDLCPGFWQIKLDACSIPSSSIVKQPIQTIYIQERQACFVEFKIFPSSLSKIDFFDPIS